MRCGLLPPTRYDFYPRPPRGGRPCSCRRRVPPAGISIHALREEGDADLLNAPVVVGLISIHALREEGDYAPFGHGEVNGDFYPRPPRGGRQAMADAELALVRISIHALREEGDLALSSRPYQSAIFLSTPSARRATAGALGTAYASNISIHALREEGDPPSDA